MPVANGTITPHRGATIELLIGVNVSKRDALVRVGSPVPERIRVMAQIDTGSSYSAIDVQTLTRLDITPIDKIKVRTPVTAPQDAVGFDQYVVSIGLDTGDGVETLFDDVEVLGCHFADDEGIQAMLGQDVLGDCLFVYTGTCRTFYLAV
ncbi:MAG TPA: hypothetical protein VN688_34545 [Gemmataceae bacterium]|nr:hypothetical protein [Gemmataceae bacterium]